MYFYAIDDGIYPSRSPGLEFHCFVQCFSARENFTCNVSLDHLRSAIFMFRKHYIIPDGINLYCQMIHTGNYIS